MASGTTDSPWRSAEDREQDRHVKKDAVLQAAARLFNERGFPGTSLDDIALSLKVTKPTLYYYIDSKEQILFECVQRGLETLRSGIRAAADQGLVTRERLRVAMENYAGLVTSEFGMCVIRVGEDPLSDSKRKELRALRSEIDAEFTALIDEGMREGWIAPGDRKVATFTVVGALSGIGRWYRPKSHGARALQEAVQHCIDMLMHGVLSAPNASPLERTQGRRAGPTQPQFTPWGQPMPAIRREIHFDQRMVRCFSERPRSLAQMLADTLAHHPNGEALVLGDVHLNWHELHHAATKCAGGLAHRGVGPGDRVALFLGNCSEFVIATLACAWLGAIVVPIGARASSPELEFVLKDAGVSLLICAFELGLLVPAPALVPALQHRVRTGGAAEKDAEGFEGFSALMQAEPLGIPHAAAEEDVAALMYTSGTTGKPKGVMLSHLNIVHSVMHYALAMGLGDHDRSVVAVPLSHVTGLVAQLYAMLYCRGCLIVMTSFKALDFVRLASAERATHAIMVPAMYNLCLLSEETASADLSSWRIGAYGGAAMPTATIAAVAERWPSLVLMNAYGATETASPATIMPRGQTEGRQDSTGLVVPCGELCVVDDRGTEVGADVIGEIWIKGPMVTAGYWNNPEATEREFCAGYWRSGDIGSIDAEGYVRVLDRKKDVINRGGYKVYCAEVENVLADHPEVVEAAIVGVPCAVLGERVHAFICVRGLNEKTSAEALKAFCKEKLADYKVPETWTIGTEPLPRNINGKLVKRELRSSLAAALS
jgi:acyl-CoA synthetase (AMP-forming)/AMP-acid ligase II/AcrR family transcriptional regulator